MSSPAPLIAALTSLLLIACGVGAAACGSRGPLDADPPLDASTADVLTNVPIVEDASPPPTDAPADVTPEPPSPLACATCVVGKCSQGILKCVQSPACQQTFQCVLTQCVAGGAPDPACFFKCASGDVSSAVQIAQIFECLTGTCGSDCSSLLAGLGGLGGGGKRAAMAQVFSSWPELCEPLDDGAQSK